MLRLVKNVFVFPIQQLGTKTLKQCVQFYYLWKKVCPEDYKQFQFQRRKSRNEDTMVISKLDIPVSIRYERVNCAPSPDTQDWHLYIRHFCVPLFRPRHSPRSCVTLVFLFFFYFFLVQANDLGVTTSSEDQQTFVCEFSDCLSVSRTILFLVPSFARASLIDYTRRTTVQRILNNDSYVAFSFSRRSATRQDWPHT